MIMLCKYYDNSCPQGKRRGFSHQLVTPGPMEDLDQLDLDLCTLSFKDAQEAWNDLPCVTCGQTKHHCE